MSEELTKRQIAQRERRRRERLERAEALSAPKDTGADEIIRQEQEEAVLDRRGEATPQPLESTERADNVEPVSTPLEAELASDGDPTHLSGEDTDTGPIDDDTTDVLLQTYEQREIQRLREDIRKARQDVPDEPVVPDESDKHGIRLKDTATNIPIQGIGGLVPGGYTEQILGGVRDAVQNTFNALDDFAVWANENIADLSQYEVQLFEELPDVSEPDGTGQQLVRGVSSFITGFIPFLKGIKMAQGATKAGKLSSFLQAETAGGITGALVFDPLENNLSNMIEEVPALSNPVTRFLAKGEEDSAAVGRIKDALEGIGAGAAFEGVFLGLRAIRNARLENGWKPVEDIDDPTSFSALGDQETDILSSRNQVEFNPSPEAAYSNRTIDDFSENEIDESYDLLSQWVTDNDGYGNSVVRSEHPKLLQEFAHTQTIDEDTIVYRGGNIRDGERLISTSKEINVAEGFKGEPGKSSKTSETVEIKIPAGAAGIDVSKVLNGAAAEGRFSDNLSLDVAHGEKEVLVPLGGDWELKYVGERPLTADESKRVFSYSMTRPDAQIKQYELVPSEKARLRDAAIEADRLRLEASKEIRIEADQLDQWLKGELPVGKLPFKINWAKIDGQEEINTLVADISQMISGNLDEARRGKITDTQAQLFAENLGMTPQDLLSRVPGQTFNAEQVIASRMVLEASASKLIDMGKQFKNSMDEKDMFQLMRMMNIHVGIQAQFQGAASEAGRALRAYQIPTGSPERQLRNIQEQLLMGGGPC